MRLVPQAIKLPVKNLDINLNIKKYVKHSELLPNNIRSLIVGPSNCGKTNALLFLLTSENGVKFENIYLYTKTVEQPKYQYLSKIMKGCKDVGYFQGSDADSIIPLEEAHANSTVIIDDVTGEKHDLIEPYFYRGRHKNIDCFYLGQTYTRIPKQLIRGNVNFLIIFKQDNHNLKYVHDEHVNTDMDFKQFLHICKICWEDDFGFLTINKECGLNNGRYRKGFDVFIML